MTPVFLLALALSVLCSDEIPVEGGVYVLSDATFKNFVAANPFVLAEFYAPWCGHCKKLEPEYSAAAEKLKDTGIKLAKVDATQNKAISEEFKVQGYPTLQFFVDGKASEYDGPREAEGIVSWLKKKTQPPADIKTVEELNTLTKSEELLVLGVFHDLKSEKALEFLAGSKKIDATAATTTSKEVRKHLKLSDGDEVVLLKQYDNLRDDLGSSWTADDLSAKVSSLGRRLVTPFTEKYQKSIFVPENKKIAFAVVDHKDKKESAKELSCVTEAAKKFREVVFVDVDSSDSGASRVLDYFGLTASSKGTLVVFEPQGSAKYRFDGKGLCDDLENFIQNYLDGKVERFLKKQKTPEDWDADHVKVLTGYNFHEIALDTNKHVFVEFYAPWCGHCKQLEPVWNKLGKYFRKRDDIVIAKIDATLNEIAEVPVESFPTLKFFPKGGSNALDYSGERNYKSLKKYVVSHAGPNPKKKKA